MGDDFGNGRLPGGDAQGPLKPSSPRRPGLVFELAEAFWTLHYG